MVKLELLINDEVRAQLPKFEQILAAFDLHVIKLEEQEKAGIIELVVNAHTLPYCRSVNTAAYDCFGEGLLGFNVIP